jgi:hypothetical protein
MIKIENKRKNVNVCTEAYCDSCSEKVRLERDSDIDSQLLDNQYFDLSLIPGRHIVHNFGYGTELDGKVLEITLCDPCLNEFFKKIKSKKD